MGNRAFQQFLKAARVAAIGALTVCGMAALIVVGSPGAALAVGEPKLLLLPIVVHSAEDPAYLREGLNDMLTARLSRIGSLDLVQPESKAAERGTAQADKARAIGEKAGADFVLFGSFTRFGQGASLDVQCIPISEGRTAEPLREIFVHSGSIGEIIPDLDELAGKVSRFARGEALSAAAATPVAGAGKAAAAVAAPAAELQSLRGRVEALEAALARLTESAPGAETAGELR